MGAISTQRESGIERAGTAACGGQTIIIVISYLTAAAAAAVIIPPARCLGTTEAGRKVRDVSEHTRDHDARDDHYSLVSYGSGRGEKESHKVKPSLWPLDSRSVGPRDIDPALIGRPCTNENAS